eukprot:s227_g23.t1
MCTDISLELHYNIVHVFLHVAVRDLHHVVAEVEVYSEAHAELAKPWLEISRPIMRRAAVCLTGHLRTAILDPIHLFIEPLQQSVIRAFSNSGYEVDLFAVTDAGEDCERTRVVLEPLNLKALQCIPAVEEDPVQRQHEEQWLQHGAKTIWNRAAFLGQLKKVQACDVMMSAMAEGYHLVARSRLDVRWHQFPADVSKLEVPGVIWLALRSTEYANSYMSDLFAIGGYSEMKPYMHVYDELLDRGNWELHKSFENSPDGLDTEELWQVTLLKAGVMARQHPDICFNLLSRKASDPSSEREDNCRRNPPRHPNGFWTDTLWSSAPVDTMSGIFSFDALLTMRLLHFFFAEWARVGRPAKVLDLGCGRGSMIERWLGFHPPSFACIDKLPGLRQILGHDLIDWDLSQKADLRRILSSRQCDLIGGSESIDQYLRRAGYQGMSRAMAFKNLLNCCFTARCVGFSSRPESEDEEVLLVFDPEGLDSSRTLWMSRRNVSEVNKLSWATPADWALLLDVAQDVPQLDSLVANVNHLATEGVIVTSPPRVLAKLQRLLYKSSFVRDSQSEKLLQPYALLRGLRQGQELQVYRRSGKRFHPWSFPTPLACTLELESEIHEGSCVMGITMGCSDDEYIWVSEYCLGWFRRGKSQGACLSDAGPTVQRSGWAYDEVKSRQVVECYLPEIPDPEAADQLDEETMMFCEDSLMQEPLPLYFQEGAWHTAEMLCQHMVLSVRLAFDAVVEINGYSQMLKGSGWPTRIALRAGQCYAWNVAPLWGVVMSFDIWKTSTSEGMAKLQEMRTAEVRKSKPGPPSGLPLAWVIADLQVRAASNNSGSFGILGLYDYVDPASAWGNGSRFWRAAGNVTETGEGGSLVNPGGSFQDVDGLASLLLAVRLAAAKVLSEEVPDLMLRAAHDALAMSNGPFKDYAHQLLLSLGTGEIAEMDGASDIEPPARVVHTDDGPRLRFSNTPVGRYLHHTATFASINTTKRALHLPWT